MAGEWIKVRHDLADDPSVVLIAKITGLSQDTVLGKLLRLWSWADRHTVTGRDISVTASWIDDFLFCSGFAEAMCKAGWLIDNKESVTFPNFDRHNGETTKKRGLAAKRQQSKRARDSVTHERDKSVTREEEDKSLNTARAPAAAVFQKPSPEEVQTFISQNSLAVDARRWFDHYEANGWLVGAVKMADWRASIRNWANNGVDRKEPARMRRTPDDLIATMHELERNQT